MPSNARGCETPTDQGQLALLPPPPPVSVRGHRSGWADCLLITAAPCAPLCTTAAACSHSANAATNKHVPKAPAGAAGHSPLKRRKQGVPGRQRGPALGDAGSPPSAKFAALLAAAEAFQAGSGLQEQPSSTANKQGVASGAGSHAQAIVPCPVASRFGCTFAGSCRLQTAARHGTRWVSAYMGAWMGSWGLGL